MRSAGEGAGARGGGGGGGAGGGAGGGGNGGRLPPGSVKFGMDTYSKVSMFFLLVALGATALVVSTNGFVFRRRYGLVLMGWYVAYTATNLAQMKYGFLS
jgi:hypothetical protein